ncbi:MAG: hypothetical protein HC831_14485, partial [Chloroflexia bacterium]|nr:hypothetical protein [Chloroflexia bacterium]
MKINLLLLIFVLILSNTLTSQVSITSTLESIPTSDDDELNSLVGDPDYLWACAATIKMPDFDDHYNITGLNVLPGKGILVTTTNGDIWCLSERDFSTVWKNQLYSEHIVQLKSAPDGKTFAVGYSN